MGKTKVKSETTIVREIDKALTAWKRVGEPIYWIKIHGSSFQKAGTPDFLGVYCGRGFGLEVKRRGGRLTALQQYRLQQIEEAGGLAIIAHSLPQALAALRYSEPFQLCPTASTVPQAPFPAPQRHKPVSSDVAQRGRLPE